MANYLFVVASSTREMAMDQWFEQDPHIVKMHLSGGYIAYYLAQNGSRDILDDRSIFRGYSISHRSKAIYFSGSEASVPPDAADPTEGCYLRVEMAAKEIRLSTDLFAQLSMLYFCDTEIIAVSDSLFVLTELRKYLGLPCTSDEQAVLARAWTNAIVAQLLSHRTVIEQISYCGLGARLAIDIGGNRLQTTLGRVPLPRLFGADKQPYVEGIRHSATAMASVVKTLAHIDGAKVTISLSGGLDSRVCLAAAEVGGVLSRTRVNSHPGRDRDYHIVHRLSTALNFPLNPTSLGGGAKVVLDEVAGWMNSNCGIYDPLYSPGANRTYEYSIFNLGGHGAEVYKGMYGWRPVASILHGVPSPCRDAFEAEIQEALEACGIDYDDKWGSEWHYLGFRNAIHSGRTTMTSLLGVRPVLVGSLVGLSQSPNNEFKAPKKGDTSIVQDLLIVMSPLLAALEFDDPAKNMTFEYVARRLEYLGGRVAAEAYSVYGAPANVLGGPPKLFLRLAERRGYSGKITHDAITNFCDAGFEAAPGHLRQVLDPLALLQKQGRNITDNRASKSAVAAGKLMSFLLSDGA